MSGLIDRLDSEWRRDAARMSAERDDIFEDLVSRHSEAHRHYHSLAHLVSLFDLLAQHASHIQPGSPPRLAVWWHDAIYDPAARDNEERSADLARVHLARLEPSVDVIDETTRLILMTKNHWDGGSAGDGDYFLDADIGILGAPADIYDRYAAGVRQEYAWAPDPAYRAGRAAFLSAAIARPRLFRTDAFEAAYANQARINMQRELAALS